MNKEQIDFIFFVIHNTADKGSINVNFRNHDGDHTIDLYSMWWDETREVLEQIDIDNIPKDKNFCDKYSGQPRDEEYIGIGRREIQNYTGVKQ